MRSRQSRIAVGSPSRVSATAFRVSASASPSSSNSAARDAWFRHPGGLPAGIAGLALLERPPRPSSWLYLQRGFSHGWVSSHPNSWQLGRPAPAPLVRVGSALIEINAKRSAVSVSRVVLSVIPLRARAKLPPPWGSYPCVLISHQN